MIGSMIDYLVRQVSPEVGLRRLHARQAIQSLRSYDAAKTNRLNNWLAKTARVGDEPNLAEVKRLRGNAWDQFDNNVYAGGAVEELAAQVIGCGIFPESTAINGQGEPDSELRNAQKDFWRRWTNCCHRLGRPGRGGFTFEQLQEQAFNEYLLSGEIFVFLHVLQEFPYLEVQLLEAERIDEGGLSPNGPIGSTVDGNTVFRGIEIDRDGRRVAYYVLDVAPGDQKRFTSPTKSQRIPAENILHVYKPTRPGQLRGASQMSRVLERLRQMSEYEKYEMDAARQAACVSMWIKTHFPLTESPVALMNPAARVDQDADNTTDRVYTPIQPGMVANLHPDEDMGGFSPNRPNSNAVEFLGHQLRGAAVGLPGVKSSSITGDFRGASFSSERAADNCARPKIEKLQDFVASHFCDPIYRRVMELALLGGEFDQVMDGRRIPADLESKLSVLWHGPVGRSINPVDDRAADRAEVVNGTNSYAGVCARNGTDWRTTIQENAAVIEFCEANDVPIPAAINEFFGILPSPAAASIPSPETNDAEDASNQSSQNQQAEAA